ncbi:hypothetical protein SEA_ASHERTHEMAN_13 [Gordonia phage Ashertheman]|uniref:Uncharacterized protein n=3 Tax=Kroosvirus TaxID=2948789 RepID=A0A3G3M800_9CAUD|nr:hypothetical protein J1764_gp13 [Gordonia phage Ashertheman]YP_010001978.1 hypothetical protein J1766_gp14 [Gordonia phage Bizzy]YP_010002148.1 hypothetical protein J1768_gp14 [Gordonia phage Ribeye]URP21081.1 hypothetical protein SEA_FLATWOODS_14 [Gordonia phage Flatwoods]WMI33023.1 hypothetical protein SEA_SCHOTTB_12 [Gordonia Phage SchottB]AXH44877.1 hypothetical protein SEA_RIBEYE_14 [Gordonia phage Ribeye]AXQ62920.1 hypothetical protein SEA_ASHERTHEMAN_13 [Gordonia phage Ashertheman]
MTTPREARQEAFHEQRNTRRGARQRHLTGEQMQELIEQQQQRDTLDAIEAVCMFAVVRALQFASMRSKASGRNSGPRFGVAQHLVHTRVDLLSCGDDWPALLRGAWDTLPAVLHGDTDPYAAVCEAYVRHLVVEQRIPDRAALRRRLVDAGVPVWSA